jgi:3-hydroxybutyryl-CoA dehydrogenase
MHAEDLALKRLVFAELKSFSYEPRFGPHPLLERTVEAGLLGRKTGKGFYEYGQASPPAGRSGESSGRIPDRKIQTCRRRTSPSGEELPAISR